MVLGNGGRGGGGDIPEGIVQALLYLFAVWPSVMGQATFDLSQPFFFGSVAARTCVIHWRR